MALLLFHPDLILWLAAYNFPYGVSESPSELALGWVTSLERLLEVFKARPSSTYHANRIAVLPSQAPRGR